MRHREIAVPLADRFAKVRRNRGVKSLVGGDLAQGGAQPAEVVHLIRERGWPAVRGNADDLLVRLADCVTPEEALRPGEPTRHRRNH